MTPEGLRLADAAKARASEVLAAVECMRFGGDSSSAAVDRAVASCRALTNDLGRLRDCAMGADTTVLRGFTDEIIRTGNDWMAAPAHTAAALLGREVSLFLVSDGLVNPYDGSAMQMYEDRDGYEYWTDGEDGHLVQAGPVAGLPSADPNPGRLGLTAEARKAAALSLACIADRRFADIHQSLTLTEDSRRGFLFFYRWEEPSDAGGTELPPFMQVAVYADGGLALLTNAL